MGNLHVREPSGRADHTGGHDTGGRAHNIAIEREGTGKAQRFGETIAPGAQAAMTLDLVPGTYRVFCPVFGHAPLGMDRSITVTP